MASAACPQGTVKNSWCDAISYCVAAWNDVCGREIPSELRDFAARSVDQARKAFEGFIEVARKTTGAVDGAAHEAQTGAKQVGSQILGIAEQNVNAAFDLAQQLAHAKDPQEAFALQSKFLKTQLDALQSQAQELGALIQKSASPKADPK
jgi:phasin